MLKVGLEKIRVSCIIGIYEEERKNKQGIIVDCFLTLVSGVPKIMKYRK